MGHRVVKRVPMDFDAAIGEVWSGYLMGPEFDFPKCSDCGGDGETVEARAVAKTFYALGAHNPYAEQIRWADKLGQAEVDHLWGKGRLTRWNRATRKHDKGDAPPTAEEVNAANRRGSPGLSDFSHDGINRWILVSFRCERLGIVEKCPRCDGHGNIATDEQRAAADAWKGTEPPEGDGWQLWETTSEGSPVSPVFPTAEALANWCADNATPFADLRWTAPEWLASFTAGTTDTDTLMVVRVPE